MHYKMISVVHQGDIMTLNLNTLTASKCMKPRLSEPQRSTTRYINHKSSKKVSQDMKDVKLKAPGGVTGDRSGI